MQHFLTLSDASPEEIRSILKLSHEVKAHPEKYKDALFEKNLLMLFELPSLRTRISFEVGMEQLGGHGIYYLLSESTLGKKEGVKDFAKVVSRLCDAVMARVKHHHLVASIAEHSDIPVINALSDYAHPCQVLCDFMTIEEKKGSLAGLKLAFVGDGMNNMTHSLLEGCSRLGMHISVATPKGKEYSPRADVVTDAQKYAIQFDGSVTLTDDPIAAVRDADVVYTDSWMSYRVPHEEQEKRFALFKPYQVNAALMAHAKPDALFMHCLPAQRNVEVTDEVIDSANSVVYDQAENRLHGQKALLLWLFKKG